MKNYIVVVTTFANLEQAQPVIDSVLSEKLAACVQIIDICSNYLWKGEICKDAEKLIAFKTKEELFGKLQEKIVSMHPYETPEVIQIPIINGFVNYLKWIDDSTI